MLSDPSCSTPSFDIPLLSEPSALHVDEDPFAPLNFDDLLDIAREFEFTRTITHIWPCEEEHDTCTEMRLEDVLAAIVPTSTIEGNPVPQPSSAPSMAANPLHVGEVDSQRSESACLVPHANACISIDAVLLPKDNDRVQVETGSLIAPTLRGWSPPSGSQFLDLDESLMVAEPTKAAWNSPWLPTSYTPSSIPSESGIYPTVSTIGDAQPQTSEKPLPTSTTVKSAEDSGKSALAPVQPSTRTFLEPIRTQPGAQANSSAPRQMVKIPHGNTPKSRQHPPAAPNANYTRAPRGGIPPHIARSVTKANIIRVEKERKVMQDAFAGTTGEAKKPSVLRRTIKAGKETGKTDENDQKGGRLAKRARV